MFSDWFNSIESDREWWRVSWCTSNETSLNILYLFYGGGGGWRAAIGIFSFSHIRNDGMDDNIKWINNKTDEMLRAYELYEFRWAKNKNRFFSFVSVASFSFTVVASSTSTSAFTQTHLSIVLWYAANDGAEFWFWSFQVDIMCGVFINRNTCKIDCFINLMSRWWHDCNRCLWMANKFWFSMNR